MAKKKKTPSLADRTIAFIEKLPITIGKDAGKNFRLRPWQKKFVREICAEKRGNRKVRRAVLSIARKNGKSTICAALALACLIGPLSELNGEIILAANSRDQAGIVYREIKRMVEMSPALQEIIQLVPNKNRAYVKMGNVPFAGSVIQAISADAHTAHGLNPSVVIFDELAQAKDRELYDTLTTAQGARENPLFLTISTQNNDPQHVLSQLIDDGLKGDDESIVVHLYAADDECDVLDEEQWKKANPALGDFLKFQKFSEDAHRASRMSSEEQAFRLLHLNQRVSLHSTFINAKDWRACEGDAVFEEGESIILAADMSAKTDLSALVAISEGENTKVQSWFWKPADYVVEHAKRDKFAYDEFVRNGYLETSAGRLVDPMDVAKKIYDLSQRYRIRALVFDDWRMDELLKRIQDDFGLDIPVIPWRQGTKTMTPAIEAFEREVLNETLVHGNHPVMNFCALNAIVKCDHADNKVLDKSKVRMRIDGAVALAMAIGYKATIKEELVTNPFEDDDFSLLDL